jgi:hypothetical protein
MNAMRKLSKLTLHSLRAWPPSVLLRRSLQCCRQYLSPRRRPFDLENPAELLLRGDEWVFGPEAAYETHGDVNNVTFPCGYTVAPDGDTLNLYYGAADTCIAMATGSIRKILDWLDRHGRIS